MPPRKRPKSLPESLKTGDRARDKTTRRTGTIDGVEDVGGRPQYALSYDEAPQDGFLTTPSKDGAQLPSELIEPE